MQQHGCERPQVSPLVDAHGLRPQPIDSCYLFLGHVLALTATLVKETAMNIWILLRD
jgi:hypothetical protein